MSFDTVTETMLDAMREQTHGTGLTLDVLKHDVTSGYALIATIDRGWNIGESANPGSDLTCQIVESSVIDADQLSDARAFAFQEAVYKILEDGVKQPLGSWRNQWTFGLARTGETFTSGVPASAFLDEAGGAFLDEAGGYLLDES